MWEHVQDVATNWAGDKQATWPACAIDVTLTEYVCQPACMTSTLPTQKPALAPLVACPAMQNRT